MTLKVQKNHYNVKLLRGYGVPINLKNNKIVLKGGSEFSTGKYEQEESFVTQIPYERIVISGKSYKIAVHNLTEFCLGKSIFLIALATIRSAVPVSVPGN